MSARSVDGSALLAVPQVADRVHLGVYGSDTDIVRKARIATMSAR
jgi:hypothetical protein